MDDAKYSQVGPVPLESDDILIISTDGIREAKNANYEDFGADRIEAITRATNELSAQEIYNTIVEAVMDFEESQDDDITLVVVKCL